MAVYRIEPQNLTQGQIKMLNMVEDKKLGEQLPEMYPIGIEEYPEIPVTYDELVDLQKAGLVLFKDYIKTVGNKSFNAYLIEKGSRLEQYEFRNI